MVTQSPVNQTVWNRKQVCKNSTIPGSSKNIKMCEQLFLIKYIISMTFCIIYKVSFETIQRDLKEDLA
jgi:hypothetical protein